MKVIQNMMWQETRAQTKQVEIRREVFIVQVKFMNLKTFCKKAYVYMKQLMITRYTFQEHM